jgi:light-independent protochlorophyllide reductase subunit B
MGFEGANVLFDTWTHPLMMGLEEHLLTMFRDDFEFNDQTAPSHLGTEVEAPGLAAEATGTEEVVWATEARNELMKIPFFVRGKARRNTERFAVERAIHHITIDTLYDAKAHYGR